MGLLKILRKIKRKEKEMRLLMLSVEEDTHRTQHAEDACARDCWLFHRDRAVSEILLQRSSMFHAASPQTNALMCSRV